ncbi:hypothetical protein [Baaleninema simplex]|uniref:hypothetical protein n=1 Tax=Baaleninema simplex TaxID=2862350 RepID=UPI0003497899|nr:hypothetical protein [Baaleninema simplex]
MSNAPTSSNTTAKQKPQKRRSLPELLEMVSIAGSGVGIGVAFLTQQVLHAAVPMTIAMSLGVINRQRFQKQMQQEYVTSITQLHQNLKTFPNPVNLDPVLQKVVSLEQANQAINRQLEHLQRELRHQAKPQQMAEMRQAIANLKTDLDRMQAFANQQRERERQVNQQIAQLHNWFEQLPQPQKATEYKRVENAIALLHRELAVIKGRLAPLEASDLSGVQANITQLQGYLQQVSDGIKPLKRRQRDMVKRLFPRMIELLNELRPTEETPQDVKKAVVHRPPPPTVSHTMRQSNPQTPQQGNGWQAYTQAEMLRQRRDRHNAQQQRQGDSSL